MTIYKRRYYRYFRNTTKLHYVLEGDTIGTISSAAEEANMEGKLA